MRHLPLRFDVATIDVASDDGDALAWLAEFLAPAFEVGEAGSGGYRVTFGVDAARHRAWATPPGATAPTPRGCFALDTRVVELPAWSRGDRTVVHDARYGCVYALGEREVEIVADAGADARRLPLLRVVREVASEAVRRVARRAQLHAAALAVGEDVILLAGPKGAGKTTLLADLLRGGGRLVANDRVLASGGADGPEVRGVPTVVSVRPDTLARFPALARAAPAVAHPSHLSRVETRRALLARGPFPPTERLRMTPGQLCDALGARAVAGGRLGAVVLPGVEPGSAGRRLVRLTPDVARTRLAACRYGGRTDRSVPTVFEELVGGGVPALDDAPLLDAIATGVTVVACALGDDAYGGGDGAAGFLRAVRAAP